MFLEVLENQTPSIPTQTNTPPLVSQPSVPASRLQAAQFNYFHGLYFTASLPQMFQYLQSLWLEQIIVKRLTAGGGTAPRTTFSKCMIYKSEDTLRQRLAEQPIKNFGTRPIWMDTYWAANWQLDG